MVGNVYIFDKWFNITCEITTNIRSKRLVKAQLIQMLYDSQDPTFYHNWSEMECQKCCKRSRIISLDKRGGWCNGNGKAGIGFLPQCWWSKKFSKNRIDMVMKGIHHVEKSKRLLLLFDN